MRLRTPSRKVCEEFMLIYELEGAQKGVDVLTRYYGVRRMKIVVDGRKIGKKYRIAEYWKNTGYFRKRRFRKSDVLHELFHHLVASKRMTMPKREEEKQAQAFVEKIMRRGVDL